MSLNTVQEIERAIGTLTPPELEELYLWLDRHYSQTIYLDIQYRAGKSATRPSTGDENTTLVVGTPKSSSFSTRPSSSSTDAATTLRMKASPPAT